MAFTNTPSYRLASAVILRAIKDLVDGGFGGPREDRWVRIDAYQFLTGEEWAQGTAADIHTAEGIAHTCDGGAAVDYYCGLIGRDWEALRDAVLETVQCGDDGAPFIPRSF